MSKSRMQDWPKRWRMLQDYLDSGEVDWSNMRRDLKLMRNIQGLANRIAFLGFWTHCEQECVSLKLREDIKVGNPEGWMRGGIFATQDSLRMARVLNRILSCWVPPKPISILEIGGGFGALARTILTHLPGFISYTLIDGPPCLEIQSRYLRAVFPSAPISFCSHDMFDTLINRRFDLVINTNSFSEMTHGEVARYFDLIHTTLRPGGLLYSRNRDKLNHDGATPDVPFKDFPFDKHWRFIHKSIPKDAPLWLEVAALRTE